MQKQKMSLVDILLNLPNRVRVRLWLRLRYPVWYTIEEISKDSPLISKQRIQKILRASFDSKLVLRRLRKTNKPGPNPYEYQVPPSLFDELQDEQIERLNKFREGFVIHEFCDDEEAEHPTTFQVVNWDNYIEISMVLVNIDKRDGSLSKVKKIQTSKSKEEKRSENVDKEFSEKNI